MSKVNVNTTNTFEEWRGKTNEIGSGLGDIATLTQNAVIVYTNNINGINEDTFVGTPATFNVTINNKATPNPIYEITIINGGSSYTLTDTIKILGSLVGGVDSVNDITITVSSITAAFAIDGVTVVGTPTTDLVAEVNQLRTEAGLATLTTTSQIFSGAINELDDLQGNVNIKGTKAASLPKSTFATITDAVKQIDEFQGNVVLTTTAQTTSGALVEHESDIGSMSFNTSTSSIALVVTAGNHVVLGSTITSGLNATKARTDFLLDQLGGKMSTDYDGPETDLISALDSLYSASSTSTLDNTYVKRNGSLDMTGMLQLDNLGVSVSGGTNPMLFKVGATGSTHEKMRIKVNGNVGIGKTTGINYKLDVAGDIAGTKLRYGTDDTDVRYLRTARSTEQTVSTPTKFTGTVKFEDPLYIGSTLVADDTLSITEWTQDRIGEVFTGNSVSGGITSTYNDTTGKISLAIANNAHTHISTNITDWTEAVQDTAGAMITGNTENGLVVTYDDSTGKLNFDVNDPVLSISGDATGATAMTNLGNTDIVLTLTDESVQDIVGAMVSTPGNTETGISVDYRDSDGTIDFVLTADPIINLTGDATGAVTLTNLASSTFNLPVVILDDSHNHVIGNIDDFTENVQDIVGNMVNPTNIESGIAVTYDDTSGKLNFDVNDPTFRLEGDVTSDTVTMTNLQTVVLTTTLTNDIIDLPDSTSTVGKIKWGDSDDLQIHHDGSNSYIDAGSGASGTGSLILIGGDADDSLKLKPQASTGARGYVEIYPDRNDWYDQGGMLVFKGGQDSGAAGTVYHPDAKIYLGDTWPGSPSDGEDLVIETGGSSMHSGSIIFRADNSDVKIQSGNLTVPGDITAENITVASTSDYKWTNGSTVESLDTKYAANSHSHSYAASGHNHDSDYYKQTQINQGGSLASTHNAGGKKTWSSGGPTGGSVGDIHYQIGTTDQDWRNLRVKTFDYTSDRDSAQLVTIPSSLGFTRVHAVTGEANFHISYSAPYHLTSSVAVYVNRDDGAEDGTQTYITLTVLGEV
jgi:hypothetical protein